MSGGHHKIGRSSTVSFVRAINDTIIKKIPQVDCEKMWLFVSTAQIIAL